MKSIKKKIIYSLLALLVVLQFLKDNHINPTVSVDNDFIAIMNPPADVKQILKSACYDCHSYETIYPWYSEVAPLSLWIDYHIDEARDELNFSEWGTYSDKRKNHKIEEVVEMVEEGEMPLASYTWIHEEAKLSDGQIKDLTDWFKSIK